MTRFTLQHRARTIALSAITLLVSTAAFAGEAIHDEVWRRYLSPAEQQELTAMKNMPQDPPPANADPAAILAGAREGFETMMRELGNPLPGQKTEPYSQGGVSGVWIRPHDADRHRALLYFHGGGYVVGNAETGAGIAGYLAEEAEIQAFSLDYPRAPESPYPAQLDNAQAAYQMLLDSGFKPQNIVVGGDSAVGNLTLALLLRLREKNMPMPAGAYLISPWVELTHSSPTHSQKKDVDVALSEDMLEWMASSYTAGQDRTNPYISPIHAGLRGFPPLLIQVGTFERLLDDALAIARNAAMADVPVRVSVWPGYYHDFQMFFSRLEGAEEALDEAAEFLEDVLDGTLLRDK
jgi:acetyl esterase/lipase